MKTREEIREFIADTLMTYTISGHHVFGFDDDLGAALDIRYDCDFERIVARAAEVFGVSEEVILSCDEEAVYKRYDENDYFILEEDMLFNYHMEDYNGTESDKRIFSMFGKFIPIPKRYTNELVMGRTREYLKELDKSAPGVYHEGAEMERFFFGTEHFCHYTDVGRMMTSFLDLCDRAAELFREALSRELNEDEIREYNFLAYALQIHDYGFPSVVVNYEMLRSFAKLYLEEGKTELLQACKIRRLFSRGSEPWRCAEFAESKAVAQRYVDMFPRAKKQMRDYAMSVANFHCVFNWSDAKMEYHPDINETADMLGEPRLSDDDMYPEITEIYVPKAAEDLGEDREHYEKLIRLSGAEKNGGLHVDKEKLQSIESGVNDMYHIMNVFQNRLYINRDQKSLADVDSESREG